MLKISWVKKNKLTNYNKISGELVAEFMVTLIIFCI
jgi:hypothetical protein